MAEPPQDELLRDLAAGREEAFAALYDQFGPALYSVARALLGSRPDAEDAVQELFTSLVRSRAGLGRVQDLRSYLFTGLRHAAGRIAASRGTGRPLPAGELNLVPQPTPAAVSDQSLRLEKALARLPAEQRELVALKIDGGLTFAEAAGVLGISPNTAASRYRYALEKLRALLEE